MEPTVTNARRNVRQRLVDTARDVHRDNSGAVMVVGVFMAVLVTGFMYSIIGIGNTIIYRERMQDAADALAFSGAVIHARGMNLIALINIVMAMLMTVYLTLRVVASALFLASLACAFACPPAAPILFNFGNQINNLASNYRRAILEPALRLGHGAQSAIRTGYPILAQANAIATSRSSMYAPPVIGGGIHPVGNRALPVKPVPIMRLCRKAAEPIGQFVALPLSFLGGVASRAGRFIGNIIATIFCDFNDDRMRPHEIDPGNNSCQDGLPGQNCEYSQIRSVVVGNTPFQGNEAGVNVANWGRGTGGGLFGTIGNFGRVGFAQAEYYYEGQADGRDNSREEWMWNMRWRARFRRFRMPSNPLGFAGLSGGLDLSLIDRVIVH
jgi:hypothetical protein